VLKRVMGTACAVVCAFGLAAVALPTGATAASSSTSCPATFQVLHNDRIGAMSLPAGAYTIRTTNLSCSSASALFSRFLADFDGVLPRPWTGNASTKSFSNGSGSGFSVKLVRGVTPPGPPTPARPVTCAGTFSVLANDRIGSISLPKGQYTIKLMSRGLSCSAASSFFARFLDSPSGVPAPWTISGSTGRATFKDNMGGLAFSATRTSSSTGGGGRSATTCGIFTVQHDDHIGSLFVPKGKYEVVLPAGSTMTCSAATKQLIAFLNAEALPRPWVVNAQTGSFAKGAGSTTTFGIDPVNGGIR
jgi:hypothetical protein